LTAKLVAVKTTIDIPEPLYKRAKIHAVERGMTLKDVVLTSLERELAAPSPAETVPASYWANRKLQPEFARLQAAGAFTPKPGDRSIDDILADIKADSGS